MAANDQKPAGQPEDTPEPQELPPAPPSPPQPKPDDGDLEVGGGAPLPLLDE